MSCIYGIFLTTFLLTQLESDHCFTELIEQDFLAIKYLHRYRRGHVFKSRTGLDFFLSGLISTSSSVAFIAVRIAYIRFLTPVHIYNFHISTIVIYHLDDLFGSNVMTRALYRYLRGHGFKSRTGLDFIFFRSYFNYQCISVHSCEDRLYSFFHRSAHI